MANPEINIIVKAEADDAIKDFRKLSAATEEVGDEMRNMGDESNLTSGKLSLLDGAMVALGGVAVNMGMQFARSIPQMVELGATFDRAQTALEGYAGGALEAEIYTKAVKDAANGAISELTAMENASRLLAMGLATNTDEAAQLTEMAITLGASMGKDAKTAFDEFTLLLANQSVERFDTFGIAAAEVRARINELTAANEGLDRQTAFMIATMEVGTQSLNELKEAGFEAGNEMEEMRAIVEDTKAEFGLMLWQGVMPLMRGLLDLRKANMENKNQALETSNSFEEYLQSVHNLKGGSAALRLEVIEARREEWEHYQVLKAKTEEMDNLAKSINNIPSQKTVDITINETYNRQWTGMSGYYTGYQGYQHGGEFMVGGMPGPDRNLIQFMATKGETVTVTPAGQSSSGGIRDISFHFNGAVLSDPYELERKILPIIRKGIRMDKLKQ